MPGQDNMKEETVPEKISSDQAVPKRRFAIHLLIILTR